MKRFIIIGHEPFNKRVQDTMHLSHLRGEGIDIAYWDASALMRRRDNSWAGELQDPGLRRFTGMDDLDAALAENSGQAIFITDIPSVWENRHIFALFAARDCTLVRLDLYGPALFGLPLAVRLRTLRFSGLGKIVRKLWAMRRYASYRRGHGLEKYAAIITTAQQMPEMPGVEICRLSYPDFEASRLPDDGPLTLPGGEKLTEGGYTVFLDQYFPLHPDVGGANAQSVSYLKAMNAFFDAYEKQSGIQVVVAMHPKSGYTAEDFGGRAAIKGASRLLIKYARAVVMHYTLSVSYAVIYHKPLLFVLPAAMRSVRTAELFTRSLAHWFTSPLLAQPGCCAGKWPPLPLPDPVADPARYQQYKYAYLTNPAAEHTPNEVLLTGLLRRLAEK